MKVFGFVVLVTGLVVVWIGITGSQHRIAAIIKGVHLSKPSNSNHPSKPGLIFTAKQKGGGSQSAGNKTSSSSSA